jgi:hypothetical protein
MNETANDIPDNVTWLQWCAGVTLSDDARERFLRCADELAAQRAMVKAWQAKADAFEIRLAEGWA